MESNISHITERIREEFFKYSGANPSEIIPLPNSASGRLYFRLRTDGGSIIGTYSQDREEARTFVYLSRHFASAGLPVPVILHYSEGSDIYFQSDLGDTTLNRYIQENGAEKTMPVCRKALELLVSFQVKGAKDLDYSYCFPRHAFDVTSVLWDLNYFKYTFLKPSGISFHEERLENDFRNLAAEAVKDDCCYFLYRDFQSRNIMIKGEELYFIDFQGGRKGSLCYDPASFIYSARSPFDIGAKNELLEFYRNELKRNNIDTGLFDKYFSYYLLIRMLQTFGAYGYRGWFERRQAFSDIMPRAVMNLNELLPRFSFLSSFPELNKVALQISNYKEEKQKKIISAESSLTVDILSFSYKAGLPADNSGNGGGFIFDCRALPNPGKIDMYKPFSGKDKPVADYLAAQPEVREFNDNVTSLVSQSVEKYISRGFTHLMVSFGCTGGQHRSVYCAKILADYLKKNYPVKVDVVHTMKDEWGEG